MTAQSWKRTVPLVLAACLGIAVGTVFGLSSSPPTRALWGVPESPPAHGERKPSSSRKLDRCHNLHDWICGKQGKGRASGDPTGEIGQETAAELHTLRIYEEVTRQALLAEWNTEETERRLTERIYPEDKVARVERAFDWVRSAIRKFIDKQPERTLSRAEKKSLRDRIRQVRLELPPEFLYSDEPELYTRTDAYFERLRGGETRLRIGGAYLHRARSWFNLIFTLAHELAHAIDPCELRQRALLIPAFERLSGCFAATGVLRARTATEECGTKDQLPEAFADWLAIRITTQALQPYALEFDPTQMARATSNAVLDLCDEEDSPYVHDDAQHPSPEIRINRLFGGDPAIRTLLSCPQFPSNAQEPSCDFDWKLDRGP